MFLNHHSIWIILKSAGWGNRHAAGPHTGSEAVEKCVTDGFERGVLMRPIDRELLASSLVSEGQMSLPAEA